MKSELCAFFMFFYLLQKQSVPDDVVNEELDSIILAKEVVKLYSKMEEYRCSIDVLKEYLDICPSVQISEDGVASILPIKTTVLHNNRKILILHVDKEASIATIISVTHSLFKF